MSLFQLEGGKIDWYTLEFYQLLTLPLLAEIKSTLPDSTRLMVFLEPLATVLKQIALLFGCLSGLCTSCFALFSDICLPDHFFLLFVCEGEY